MTSSPKSCILVVFVNKLNIPPHKDLTRRCTSGGGRPVGCVVLSSWPKRSA